MRGFPTSYTSHRATEKRLHRSESDAPIATGDLARTGDSLERVAAKTDATPAQAALTWLLRRSPVTGPS